MKRVPAATCDSVIASFVERTCRDSGVGERVTDLGVIETIAAILRAGAEAPSNRSRKASARHHYGGGHIDPATTVPPGEEGSSRHAP